ncbi:MAG: diguanylate cyclase [Cycloclasticus sp.]
MDSNQSSSTESISGLPNATEFSNQTEQLLEFSTRTHAKAIMLFITFESLMADANEKQNKLAINAISERLLSTARESDIYAYLGGMGFANLSIATSEHHASILAEKLKNELVEPFKLSDGSTIKLNAKIGIAEFPEQGKSYQELINKAQNTVQ